MQRQRIINFILLLQHVRVPLVAFLSFIFQLKCLWLTDRLPISTDWPSRTWSTLCCHARVILTCFRIHLPCGAHQVISCSLSGRAAPNALGCCSIEQNEILYEPKSLFYHSTAICVILLPVLLYLRNIIKPQIAQKEKNIIRSAVEVKPVGKSN